MIYVNKNSKFFTKKIKLQLQLGFSKLTPKLNLTLAPLGINLINFVNDFNKFNYFFFDNNNILNCNFFINTIINNYILNVQNNNMNFIKKTFTSYNYNIIFFINFIYFFEIYLKNYILNTNNQLTLKNFLNIKKHIIINNNDVNKIYIKNNFLILKLNKVLFKKLIKQNKILNEKFIE